MSKQSAAAGELVSALMDGQLSEQEFGAAIDSIAGTAQGVARWNAYHLVGDALRGGVGTASLDGDQFVARLRGRLTARDPGRPALDPVSEAHALPRGWTPRDSANDPAMRWKLLAGCASLAAVVAIGWQVVGVDAGSAALSFSRPVPPAPVAAAPAVVDPAAGTAATSPLMLRDPQLDELLAAHKRFGGASALQMPAGFLRNATFDASQR